MDQGIQKMQLECCRCQYRWVPRKPELPVHCPSCRSIKWNQPNLKVRCERCGHEWNSHDGNPARCPACGSAKWNVPLIRFCCTRCGHEWSFKGGRTPRKCPECLSKDWNKAKVRELCNNTSIYTADQMEAIAALSMEGKNPVQISSEVKVPYSVVIDRLNGKDITRRR